MIQNQRKMIYVSKSERDRIKEKNNAENESNKLFQCRACNKNINIDKELLKCNSKGERNSINKRICLNCYNFYESTFEKDYYKGRICILICPECGNIKLSGSSALSCNCGYSNSSVGKKLIQHECPECHKIVENYSNNFSCDNCGWKRDYIHICPNCGEKNINNGSNFTCKTCKYSNYVMPKFNHKCLNCNYSEINSIPVNVWICPRCNKSGFEQEIECPECNFIQIINSTIWTCNNCNYTNLKINHKCEICNYEWKDNIPEINTTCPNCNYKKDNLYNHKCPECGFEEITNQPIWKCKCGYINKKASIFKHICKNCNFIEENTKPVNNWICPECGWKPYNFICYFNNNSNTLRKCNICNQETPHKYNKNKELYCQVCAGEKIWCNHCQQWETIEYNCRPNHWVYWAAETRIWINENPEKIELMKNIIINFDILFKSKAICGVYGWFINNNPVYIGESTDILTRSYNHIMYMFETPEYWYNIINNLKKNKIEIKIFERIDRDDYFYIIDNNEFKQKILKPLELKWIDKLKPDSQKCDGTDHIRPIYERQLKINK